MDIPVERVRVLLFDLREVFERKIKQSILKRDDVGSLSAIGGLDALELLEKRLQVEAGCVVDRRSRVTPLRGSRP
jgi:hypothetical protein